MSSTSIDARSVVASDWGWGPVCVALGLCVGGAVVALGDRGLLVLPLLAIALLLVPWLLKDPYRLFLFLLLTWPLLTFRLQITLPAGLPDIKYERVVLAAVLGMVLTRWVVLRERLPRLDWWVCAFALLTVLSYARVAVMGGVAAPELSRLVAVVVQPLGAYWLVLHLVDSRRKCAWLLATIVMSCVAICVTGLYEQVLQLEFSAFDTGPGGAPVERMLDGPGGRAAGVMLNPAVYGAVMVVGALAAICWRDHVVQVGGRTLLGLAAGLLLYGVFASYTRSAWLSGLVMVPLMLVALPRMRRRMTLAVSAGVVVTVCLLSYVMQHELVERRLLERGNVVGRVERMVWSLQQVPEHPFLGWGAGAADVLMSRVFQVGGFDHSHNSYLTMLIDGGLLLFVCFLAILARWFQRFVRVCRAAPRHSFERSVAVAMCGFVLAWLVSGMFLELKHFGYFYTLFWIAGAMMERLAELFAGTEDARAERLRSWRDDVPACGADTGR